MNLFHEEESSNIFNHILMNNSHIEEVEIATGVDQTGLITDLIGVVAKGGDLYVSNKKDVYDHESGVNFSMTAKQEPYVRLLISHEGSDDKSVIEIGCHKGTIYINKVS